MPTLSLEQVYSLSYDALKRCGANTQHAEAVAQELKDAEAEGIRNVGLGYIHLYLQHLQCGKVSGDAVPEIVKTSHSTTVVDASFGFCHTAYLVGEDRLIQTAKEQGTASLVIQRSYSAGVLGWFVRRLAQQGLAAIMFANSSKAVAAHGGKVPFFGTNPFAFGFPRAEIGPVVVDMATASTARVNLVRAANAGEPIELGHAIDEHGEPTTDPAAGLKGAQLPVGGPKGFGLGLMVDLMAGVLTGSHCSYEAPMFSNNEGGPPNVGQTIIAMNPDFFSTGHTEHLATMLTDLTADNDVRIPGERREQLRLKHETEGVDVPQSLLDKIESLCPSI